MTVYVFLSCCTRFLEHWCDERRWTSRHAPPTSLSTPAVNVALPASAATELRAAAQCFCSAGRAAIKRYLLPAAPTAANPPHAAAAGAQDSASNYSTEQVSRDYTYTAAQSNAGVKPKKTICHKAASPREQIVQSYSPAGDDVHPYVIHVSLGPREFAPPPSNGTSICSEVFRG